MSAEQWDAFLEKVESDTQLQENLKDVTTPEAAIAIAKAAGYSITANAGIFGMDQSLEPAVAVSSDPDSLNATKSPGRGANVAAETTLNSDK